MNTNRINTLLAALVILCSVFLAPKVSAQHGAAAPASAVDTAPQTTEQRFKNIQVLKGVQADQLLPAMQFISASLGVQCEFCHVDNAREKDDKKPKLMARKMIEMELAINKDHFNGRQEVTCFSCHRGTLNPVSVPAIPDEEPKRPLISGGVIGPEFPAADQIIDKYLAAVGGADALRKNTSRIMKGDINFGQQKFRWKFLPRLPTNASPWCTRRTAIASRPTTATRDGWAAPAGGHLRT